MEDSLYRLIRIALLTSEPVLPRVLSETEWRYVLELARKQAIVGVLADAVDKLPEKYRPPMSVALEWLGETTCIAQRNEVVSARVAEVRSLFAESGFKSCVLKGQSVAALYPNPKRRQSGDIDLWVGGGRSVVLPFVRSKWHVGSVVYHHCHAGIFEDVPVEVHFWPTWFYNPILNIRLRRYLYEWSSTCFSSDGVIPTEFNLVYSMIHIFRHIFHEGVGLRQLMDYYYILRSSSAEERSRAYVALCRFGLGEFCGAVMYVLTNVFGLEHQLLMCPVSVKRGSVLLAEIEACGNFGKMDNQGETKGDKLRRFALYYPREVLWAYPWKIWHYTWRLVHGYL